MSTASAIAPLMIARFRRLWSANLLANIGAMAQAVTAAWLMTEMTAGDPTLVAAVQTCASLPLVLLSLPGGALADLFTPRHVMLAAQVLVLCAGVTLLALAASGRIGPAALLCCVFASGAGFALANPAWHASIRDQTGDDRLLEPAVLLNAVGFNLARSLGPAVGGWLIALAGPLVALAASVTAVVPLIAALWAWRPAIAGPIQREPLRAAIHAGIRYVRWRPSLAALILRACLFTFSGASIWALAPLVAHQRLSGGAAARRCWACWSPCSGSAPSPVRWCVHGSYIGVARHSCRPAHCFTRSPRSCSAWPNPPPPRCWRWPSPAAAGWRG
ncbi:MFS transporter [Sphingomonas colocasiae]|uniref:MFS transporter n=1 Tax=Sphingomonas colocasiae TaxID=1848973 RepID=A0ABS7PSB1_9SPHN|nr:MFS transporter [Sphingomonas colocasiae]